MWKCNDTSLSILIQLTCLWINFVNELFCLNKVPQKKKIIDLLCENVTTLSLLYQY